MSGARVLSQPRAQPFNARSWQPRSVGDLHLWATGDALQASDLNANFLLLLGLIGTAAAQHADPLVARAVADNARAHDRLDALQQRLEAQAQLPVPWQAIAEIQRRLFELGTLAEILQRRLEGGEGISNRNAANVALRLDALESAPPPPSPISADEVATLRVELAKAQEKVTVAERHVIAMRGEIFALKKELAHGNQARRPHQGVAAGAGQNAAPGGGQGHRQGAG